MESQRTLFQAMVECSSRITASAKTAFIFRASIAYISQHIQIFVGAVSSQRDTWTDVQFEAARQIVDLFKNFESLIANTSDEKWIQPALNWPTDYLHRYIAGLRQALTAKMKDFGFSPDIIKFSQEQEVVNQQADLQHLKSSLQGLMAQVDINDAVGVQQQIETKLAEVRRFMPSSSKGSQRRPSSEYLPMSQMRKRVEELLSQFKNINITDEDIQKKEQIGAGGFGTVYKAIRLSTGELVAVKELRSDRLTMSSWTSLYAEVESMASVRHPYVLELVGAHITEPYRIITRFCSGKSLFDRLHRSETEPLTATDLTKYGYEVALGMAYLHNRKIVHRDLKTLNILLDEDGHCCVADFGLSGMMRENHELVGGVGTPHYTAPEVLNHSKYGPKVDIFSFGVVLWEMLMRKVPYSDMSHAQIYEHVVTRGWRLPIPNDTPEGLKHVITHCWSKNPSDRPDFSEIVQGFESGQIYFPGSEKIDFIELKNLNRAPHIDIDYTKSVLKNVDHPNFSSICYFLASANTERICSFIKPYTKKWLKANHSFDAILTIAGHMLHDDELGAFLQEGGLRMFETLIQQNRNRDVAAAVNFGCILDKKYMEHFVKFLPGIVDYLLNNSGYVTHSIVRFLARFDDDLLMQFVEKLKKAILVLVPDVSDEPTFRSIMSLIKICHKSFTEKEILQLYDFLGKGFSVSPSFVEILINASDDENISHLVTRLLGALVYSNIEDVFIDLIIQCVKKGSKLFSFLHTEPQFFESCQNLIKVGKTKAVLLLVFCMAGNHDAAIELSRSQLLGDILALKNYLEQLLQISTALTIFEDFCYQTLHMEAIMNLLVSALSGSTPQRSAHRLLGAMTSHKTGCSLLADNGVLELFIQLFLSSPTDDSSLSLTVLQNISQQGDQVPQVSLIASCLIQDLVQNSQQRVAILQTLVGLVTNSPNCIQLHDLRSTILPQLGCDQPAVVYNCLKIFSFCDVMILQEMYSQILAGIHRLLGNELMHYPEIISAAISVIGVIAPHCDLTNFIVKTRILDFANATKSLLGSDHLCYASISEQIMLLESLVN